MLTDERIYTLWAEAVGGEGLTVETFSRAVEREARREALEEAAKVCKRIGERREQRADIVTWATNRCAGAIRALIEKEPRT